MDENLQEMEQEQESTTTIQEQEQEQETTTTIQEQEQELSNSEEIDFLPDNSENIIHELFSELGVNLDYTPTNNFQCFTMALQFVAALWFIWWFVKFLFSVLRSMLSPRYWK